MSAGLGAAGYIASTVGKKREINTVLSSFSFTVPDPSTGNGAIHSGCVFLPQLIPKITVHRHAQRPVSQVIILDLVN